MKKQYSTKTNDSLPKLGKRSLSSRSGKSEPEVAIPEPNDTVPGRSDWEIYKDADNKYHNAYLM
jgi:hypothetical protein